MGVCNVTPDSFSDGGKYFHENDAKARVDALIDEGVDIIDVGGESTRPGAASVSAAEQIRRVLPAIRHAIARGICVSIDTTHPDVAAAALEAGAHAINDVSCLRTPELARLAKDAGAAFVLMHSRGTPETMQSLTDYEGDLVESVMHEWRAAADRTGLAPEALVMDPGIGFAKTGEQSLELVRRTVEIVDRAQPHPVLVGASRKSFLKIVDPTSAASDRIGGSIAAAIHAARAGASILRVHDVRATRQALVLERRLG